MVHLLSAATMNVHLTESCITGLIREPATNEWSVTSYHTAQTFCGKNFGGFRGQN